MGDLLANVQTLVTISKAQQTASIKDLTEQAKQYGLSDEEIEEALSVWKDYVKKTMTPAKIRQLEFENDYPRPRRDPLALFPA